MRSLNKAREWQSRVRTSVKCLLCFAVVLIFGVYLFLGIERALALLVVLMSSLIMLYSVSMSSRRLQLVAVGVGVLLALIGSIYSVSS